MSHFTWANDHSRQFLARGYLRSDETAEQRVREIADHAEMILGLEGFADKFYDYMGRGFYSLASPIWSNFGREGLPISCNGTYFGDSISGMLESHAEVGMMTKHGAGTSGYFGDIRPRGTAIAGGALGGADGPVHYMQMIETLIDVVSQGNVRRGNFSPYLPVEHPDIEEFLEMREEGNSIQKLSPGVTITDAWMNSLLEGDLDKRRIWARIVRKRFETGFPYVVFIDNANNAAPPWYRGKIKASNLCVSGDTLILTDEGHLPIAECANSLRRIWNGEEWSEVEVFKTNSNQKLVRVQTSSGQALDCTPYHKFYIIDEYHSEPREVQAGDLKPGQRLMKSKMPVVEGQKPLVKAYTNGFYSGDGCSTATSDRVDLYGEKRKLKDFIEHDGPWREHRDRDAESASVRGLQPKFFVPDASYTLESRLTWFSGLLDADGTVARNGTSESFQLASINRDFLRETQLMLQTLGVQSWVSKSREEGKHLLPANDGSGELKEFNCQTVYRLLINSCETQALLDLGLECRRLQVQARTPQRNAAKFSTVVSVEPVEGLHDTFCFTEPKRHLGVFNGILTGQCTEIFLPSNEYESFVCDLSSMNLLHFDEWEHTDAVGTLIFFLDAVMSEYIDKTAGIEFMQRPREFAIRHRALGLGSLGYHSKLMQDMIPFESMAAKLLNVKMHKAIYEQADEASRNLATLFGEPAALQGTGRRNGTVCAIAPTKSSSFIHGQVSQSIEPITGNVMIKNLAKGKFTWRNPQLERIIGDDEALWTSISENGGSVQHLDFEGKEVFKTFAEISQLEIVQQAAARGHWVDQGQSLNLMIHPRTPAKDVSQLMIEAWKMGLKSLYYQKGTNLAQELVRDVMSCNVCEA